MDKIKDIFSPGHRSDADVLYGSQQSANPPAHAGNTGKLSGEGSHLASARDAPHAQHTAEPDPSPASTVGTTNAHHGDNTVEPGTSRTTTAAPNPAAEKDTGLARQVVNPDGAKYDESRFGTKESAAAATTTLPDHTRGTIHSTPAAEKDTGLKRQTPNPGNHKYDETRYSNTSTIKPMATTASKAGALEPVGGVSHSSGRGQGIVGGEPSAGNLRPSEYADEDDITVASVRSGVIGDTPHAKELTDTDIPVGPDTTSRSTAATGAGTGAGAGAAAAAAGAGSAAILGSSTDRSFPLSGGATKDTAGPRDTLTTHNEPSTLGSTSDRTAGGHGVGDSHKGLAEAAAAAAYAGHEHGGHGHSYEGPNTDAIRSGPTFTSGPHATETANRLDPNNSRGLGSPNEETLIPAPLGAAGATHARTTYEDQRASAPRASGTGMPGAYPDSAAATPAHEEPKSTTGTSSRDHHYGRDAAVAVAGAAAAGGLYEAHRKGSTDTDPATFTHGPHKSNIANIVDPRVLPDPAKMKGHQAQSTETDPASKTVGPHSSNVANVLDPRVLPEPEKMKQHTTAGPHQSDTLNRADPRVDSDLSKDTSQHHYGRDAAVAGAVGAGAAGAHAAAQHQGERNPYTSHPVDPRVHGSSTTSDVPSRTSSTKGGWFAGPAGSAVDSNKITPPTSTTNAASTGLDTSGSTQPAHQHHYGRDAAVAGGVGLAGVGAGHAYKQHEAEKATDNYPSGTTGAEYTSTSQPPASMISSSQPAGSHATTTQEPANQHHYGRDAALAGGAGLAGAGIAHHKYGEHNADKAAQDYPAGTTSSSVPDTSSRAQPPYSSTSAAQPTTSQSTGQHHHGRDAALAGGAGLVGSGAAYEYQRNEAEKAEREHPYGTTASRTGTASNQAQSTADPTRTFDDTNKHHYGRDAAAVGGVGAAAAGAHEYSKHAAEKTEKENLKEAEKAKKEHLKQVEKEAKQHDKELEKEEKKQLKDAEKEEKKHQKELEKEEKKHQKELEKEEKKHQKELEKDEKKKHGGGLLGFLHRDKDKEEEEKVADPTATSDKHHRAEEAAGAAGVAGAGAAAYEHHENGKHDRNRLHKDPPAEYSHAHGGEHYGTDGRIGQAGAVSGLEETRPGEYGTNQSGEKDGIVIEPHTGLPMNVGKYGSGAGGTDGNQAIHGHHTPGAGTGASGANVASQGNIGPDWENIKKANTPY